MTGKKGVRAVQGEAEEGREEGREEVGARVEGWVWERGEEREEGRVET